MTGIFCSTCDTEIAVHADGTAMCSCASVEFDSDQTVNGIKSAFGITADDAQAILERMKSEHSR